jgi:hypothetical protein
MALYWLARELDSSRHGAFIGGLVFAFAPYKLQHYAHLELLFSPCIPCTFAAIHRGLRTRRLLDLLAIPLFVILQFLSGLYYGLFLIVTLAWVCPILYVASIRQAKVLAMPLAAALIMIASVIVVAGVLYGHVFATALGQQRDRSMFEINEYSATPHDFLVLPQSNRLYAPGHNRSTSLPERTFFPGVTSAALALIALAQYRHRRLPVALYTLILLFGATASLGFHAPLYRLLYYLFTPFRSVRVPARFGVFYLFGLAVLSAIGVDRALELFAKSRDRAVVTTALIFALCVEYASRPIVMNVTTVAPAAYNALNRLPFGPIAELPMPRPDALPGQDPEYEYLSTFHWRPMLNGYSGFYPESYLQLLETLTSNSTRGAWLDAIESAQAEYIVFHLRYASSLTDAGRVLYIKTSPKWNTLGSYPGTGEVIWLFGRRR